MADKQPTDKDVANEGTGVASKTSIKSFSQLTKVAMANKDTATASRTSITSLSQLTKAAKRFVKDTKLDDNPNKDKAIKGVLGLAFLWFVFGHGAHILQNMVGKVYPAYRSVQALVKPLPECDNIGQWLTYWVVFAIFTLADFWLNIFIGWLPIYGISKVVLLCWLVAGSQPVGAQIVYHKIVWPFFNKHRAQIDRYADSVNAKAGEFANMAMETAKDVAAEQQVKGAKGVEHLLETH